jgi:hypothetical protein
MDATNRQVERRAQVHWLVAVTVTLMLAHGA